MVARKKASAKKVEQETVKKVSRASTRKARITHTACRYFARNVSYTLKVLGKSENAFAKQLDVTQPYLNRLLKCQYQPVLSTAILISEALDIPLDILISPQLELLQEVLRAKVAAKKSSQNSKNALAS